MACLFDCSRTLTKESHVKTIRLLWPILAAIVVCTSCSSTHMVSTWSDPSSQGKTLKKIAVVGFRRSDLNRRLFEDEMSIQLRQHGTQAEPSYTFMSEQPDTNADALLEQLKGKGFDGVLISHVIGLTTEVLTTPDTRRYVPEARYNRFGNYYRTVMAEEIIPGTETVTDYNQIQTHLYRISDGNLIWAGQSETERTGDLQMRIQDYSKAVVGDLAKNDLLQK
jgi:hypothetical protein